MFNSVDGLHISIPNDEDGMVGRECPVAECEGYFKIKLGTGIIEEGYNKCFCPYCGHANTQDHFFTKEQLEYAESIAISEVQKAIGAETKKWDRKLRSSSQKSFINLRVDYKQSHRSIAYYAEKELETNLVCESCTLEYAVYGKFAYCPDCGADNTLQILMGNLYLVRKLLVQAKEEEDPAFQEYLVQNALEDIISSFDSFGRNNIKLITKNTDMENFSISFQNITKAREMILKEFGFDIFNGLEETDWEKIVVNFQKRHLISHNDGIIDEMYIQKTNDKTAVVGRKVVITPDELEDMLEETETIARILQEGLTNWKSQKNSKGG